MCTVKKRQCSVVTVIIRSRAACPVHYSWRFKLGFFDLPLPTLPGTHSHDCEETHGIHNEQEKKHNHRGMDNVLGREDLRLSVTDIRLS